MSDKIKITDIYDKNINFLIGSGATAGLLPTLELKIKNESGSAYSLEELVMDIGSKDESRKTQLFMHYYSSCIKPAQSLNISSLTNDSEIAAIINYEKFLTTILKILSHNRTIGRHCNIFTTNYDGCIPLVADKIIKKGIIDFNLNDGARGLRKRQLQTKNFNSYLCQTGIFEKNQTSIPQINLMHLHGSVYWKREGESIVVDYNSDSSKNILNDSLLPQLKALSDQLNDESQNVNNLVNIELTQQEIKSFWESYNELPIVNPTKWKFHETLFEEHYYQMLRMLSYELEKPNAILIAFGFSFSDEHILNIIKRSLANPHLQLFVCCYNSEAEKDLRKKFLGHNNVDFIKIDGNDMDFDAFNESVFNINSETQATSIDKNENDNTPIENSKD